MPKRRIRAIVVDDFVPWREAVRRMLRQNAEMEIVAEAGDGQEAVEVVTDLKPDLVLLDIGIPRLNGIEVSTRIHRASPGIAIVFVTMNNNAAVMQQAFGNGARGYVLKSDAGKELWPAIQAVLEGKRYASSGCRLRHLCDAPPAPDS